jgi:pyruvate ferredoxin oxidoreductase beta subunit
MAAHHIPYVAQASIGYWQDLVRKAEKAFAVEGPAFIDVLAPCPRGWRHGGDQTTNIARLAVETGFWPLFEVEKGVWKLTMPARARELKPVSEFLKAQGRFKHLFKPENEELLDRIQQEVDEYYTYIKARCEQNA